MSGPGKSPRSRGEQVRESFEKKLAILERLADMKKARLPLKTWYPTSLREFREWQSTGDFISWSSQSIDAPNGKYPQLSARLAQALDVLRTDPIERENETLRAINTALMKQNVLLEAQVRKLDDQIRLLNGSAGRANVIALYRGDRKE
jgi:hypothetical protein